MSLEEAYKLINVLYEKYNKKEEKRNDLVCNLIKKQDGLKFQIAAENLDIYLLKNKIKEENIKENEDAKFMRGFNLRLIVTLGLSILSLAFFKSFIILIFDLLLTLLVMGTYSISYTIKNGHLPFRKRNEDYIAEIENNIANRQTKKEALEKKKNQVAKEIQVYSHITVYNEALKILRELAIGLNEKIGLENYIEAPLENREIEWLNDMGRKIKREK